MKTGTVAAVISTGIVVLLSGLATGIFGWMIAALSYDYYHGQQRALNIYVNFFIAWAVITTMIMFALGMFGTYILSNRHKRNAFVAAIASTVASVVLTILLHLTGLFISSSVASWFRTT